MNENFNKDNQKERNQNDNLNFQETELRDNTQDFLKSDFENNNFGNSDDILEKDYEWDYERYNKQDKSSKEKSYKNRGTVVFASIFGSLVAVPVLAFGGIKLSHMLSDIASQENDYLDKNNLEIKIASKESPFINNDNKTQSTLLNSVNSNQSATQIAKKVIPSVVSVVPYVRRQSFYQTGIVEAGIASGIIVSENGYIVTNAHAVLKTSSEVVDAIKIILHDNKEYEAKIIGVDFNTDLSVLKIDANNLPTAELGDSDSLEVGEPVFAIGSPSGLEFAGSMTSGIVSALNRTFDSSSTLGNDNKYIQTDAAINGGNSGGALVNIKGQVIGINSRKLTGDVEGMGFAIPITSSTSVLNDLIKYGYVKGRVKLGIVVEKEIDEFISKLNGVQTGLLINSVESNPDLVNKGIQQYDILHQINNVKISSMKELKDELKKYKPEDHVNLVFYRYDSFGNNGRRLEVNVKLLEDKGIIINNNK